MILHRGKSRTRKATKVEIVVLTLMTTSCKTVVTKNFVLDATYVIDLQSVDLKLAQANVFIILCTLSVSAVQSSTIKLEQRFVESHFDFTVLIVRRQNAERE